MKGESSEMIRIVGHLDCVSPFFDRVLLYSMLCASYWNGYVQRK